MTSKNDDDDDSLIDTIQPALERKKWVPVSGKGWRWVNHEFDNGHGRLVVRWLPPRGAITFDFESDTHAVRLDVSFEKRPEPVLGVIFRYQSKLSDERWPAFIEELLAVSPKVVALTGEDSEDKTPITTVDGGVRALRERDELDGLAPD